MANDEYLMSEENIPENWVPADVPLNAPAVTTRIPKPKFFSGSLPPNLQHDASFVGTEPPSNIPKNSLMPFGNQSNPFTNAAAQSTAKIIAQQVVKAQPPSSSGVSSVALTMPSIFVAPVAGSPGTGAVSLAVALAPEPPNFVFAGPANSQGTVAIDTAAGVTFGTFNVLSTTTATPSTLTTQANDFALVSFSTPNSVGSGITPPDASWTQIFALTNLRTGLYWKNVSAAGTASATIVATNTSYTISTGIITVKTSGGTPVIRNQASVDTLNNGGNVPVSVNLVLAGSTIFLAWTGAALQNAGGNVGPVNGLTITDNQGNTYTQLTNSYQIGISGTRGGTQCSIFSATALTSGNLTISWTSLLGATWLGEIGLQAIEVTNLAPPTFLPIFRALISADIPPLDTSILTSGLLALARGGTNADLSATGGINQVLQQTGVGAAITVGQLANKNLLSYAATSQKAESAADANVLTFTPPNALASYRLRFVMSVSAANAATLGWTATWKDSNGNAQAPANLALFQAGAAPSALTFTTSVAGDYYGQIDIDVNSATNIVIQLTFTGTSFAAKVSATIERII